MLDVERKRVGHARDPEMRESMEGRGKGQAPEGRCQRGAGHRRGRRHEGATIALRIRAGIAGDAAALSLARAVSTHPAEARRGRSGRPAPHPADRRRPRPPRLERGRRAAARGGADGGPGSQSRPGRPSVAGRGGARRWPACSAGSGERPRRPGAGAGRPAGRVGPCRPPGRGRRRRSGSRWPWARRAPPAPAGRCRRPADHARPRPPSRSSGAPRSRGRGSRRCCWPGRKRGRTKRR